MKMDTDLLKNYNTITDEQVLSLKSYVLTLFENTLTPDMIGMGVQQRNGHFIVDIIIKNNNEMKYNMIVHSSGNVYMIVKITPVDIDSIQKNCILQELPDYLYKCKLIRLTPENEPDCYIPLEHIKDEPTPKKNPDKWLRCTEYDKDGLKAFIANRYKYGMNIAFMAANDNVVYYCESYNFDYPEGIAIRKTHDDIEIYLDNDAVERNIIYESNDKNDIVHLLEYIYPDSSWVSLEPDLMFRQLYDSIANKQS